MEAGAHLHQDPARMTQEPRAGAVREGQDDRSGWVAFAGAYLLIAGCMNVIWGIVALDNKSAFVEGGLVWSNLNTWGWVAIVAGGVQILAGLLVLAGRFAGRWLAGIMALVGLFMNFLSAGAYPLWSVIALVANGLVLWAVTVHGDAFD
jgi:hypothetical protein